MFQHVYSKNFQFNSIQINNYIFSYRFIAPPFYYLFWKTPKSGAQTSIKCAVDPDLENVTGKYFSDCKEKGVSRAAKDDETALWLWNESEKWVGL